MSTEQAKKLRADLFETTLKDQAWAKTDGDKFIPCLGDIEVGRKQNSLKDAVKKAEEVRMISLADNAAWIVGEGNEYRGVIGKFLQYGN